TTDGADNRFEERGPAKPGSKSTPRLTHPWERISLLLLSAALLAEIARIIKKSTATLRFVELSVIDGSSRSGLSGCVRVRESLAVVDVPTNRAETSAAS